MTWTITDTKKLDRNTLTGELFTNHWANENWRIDFSTSKWEIMGQPSQQGVYRQGDGRKDVPLKIRIHEKEVYWDFQKWAVSQVADIFAPAAEPAREVNASLTSLLNLRLMVSTS